MSGKKYWIAILCCCITFFGIAQSSPKDFFERGKVMYNNGKYHLAIPLFLKYQEFSPQELEVKYLLGISYLKSTRPERAIDYLKYVAADKKAPEEVQMYLGQACQLNYEFEQAIRHYKAYLGKMKMKDPFRESIKDDIKRCVIGRKMVYREPLGDVENITEINTAAAEYAPLCPPSNENKLYFATERRTNIGGLLNKAGYRDTLTGAPRADIYESDLARGLWENHRPVEVKYNSRRHDILYGFSQKGEVMYTQPW